MMMKGSAVDPLSLSALSAAVLNQAFGFLFGRLASVLDRRKDRAEAAVTEEDSAVLVVPPIQLAVNEDAVHQHMTELAYLRRLLAPYEARRELVDHGDRELLADLEKLRDLLEGVYGHDFTFRGEQRNLQADRSYLDIEVISGDVTGVDTQGGPEAQAIVRSKKVTANGRVIGVRRRTPK